LFRYKKKSLTLHENRGNDNLYTTPTLFNQLRNALQTTELLGLTQDPNRTRTQKGSLWTWDRKIDARDKDRTHATSEGHTLYPFSLDKEAIVMVQKKFPHSLGIEVNDSLYTTLTFLTHLTRCLFQMTKLWRLPQEPNQTIPQKHGDLKYFWSEHWNAR